MKDKEVGIVLMGGGGTARAWLAAYGRLPSVRIVGIYDADPTWARRLASETPGAAAFTDPEEVLAHPDVLAVEINLAPDEAMDFAVRCVESGIAVGLRTTAVTSSANAERLLENRKRKSPIRLFSPAFYFPPVDLAREALDRTLIGDAQTIRVRSIFGRHGAAETPLISYPMPPAPDLCGPEYEALPLMFLLGEVKSVHAFRRRHATVITWTSGRGAGGARFGVYEALNAPDLAIRSTLEPVDETFEIAGTDGYIFGSGLTGRIREQPAYSCYVGDSFTAPAARTEDDPMASYFAAAQDLAHATRRRAATAYGPEWVIEIGLVRDAIGKSLKTQQEISIETDSGAW